jgi:hypothetical protein
VEKLVDPAALALTGVAGAYDATPTWKSWHIHQNFTVVLPRIKLGLPGTVSVSDRVLRDRSSAKPRLYSLPCLQSGQSFSFMKRGSDRSIDRTWETNDERQEVK